MQQINSVTAAAILEGMYPDKANGLTERTIAHESTASSWAAPVLFFAPDPSDAILAGIAATRYGGAILKGISKFADDIFDGVKGFFKGGDEVAEILSDFSGGLEKVNISDDAADGLAKKINGQSSVKFKNDPKAREFDAISDEFIAQAKTSGTQLSKSFRNQAKATFQAAKDTGKKVYYEFKNAPSTEVREKLYEYSERYGVDIVIDELK